MAKQTKKKSSAASKSKTLRAASEKNDQKKVSGGKSKQGRRVDDERRTEAAEKRKRFSEQYMPYILGAVGFVLATFFILHVLCMALETEEYWTGPFGRIICGFFFGCFGWAAFFIPIILFYLTAFWRKSCREGTVVLRIVLSFVLMVLISAVAHVFVCAGNEAMAKVDIPLLYEQGSAFVGSGVVGGLVGLGLYTCLNVWGTVIVSIVVFPLLIAFLVGVTPAYVASLVKKKIAESREERKARESEPKPAPEKKERPKRQMKEASLDDEDEDMSDRDRRRASRYEEEDDDFVPPSRSTGARRKENKKVSEPREEDFTPPASAPKAALQEDEDYPFDVDTETGEVLPRGANQNEAQSEVSARTASEEMPFAEDAEDTDSREAEELYVPARPSVKDRKSVAREPRRGMRAQDNDVFASDDLPEETDTMEVSLDDDADELMADRDYADTRTQEKERFVVVVNKQETAALTDTADFHVNGLSDEEVVIPSAKDGEASHTDDPKSEYHFPSTDLLTPGSSRYEADEDEIARNTQTLREVLESFHIRVKEVSCSCGPTITRYEVKPDTGVRVRSIANLVDDIALGLAKSGVRIEAPIPGKAAVGIEVPNEHAATVYLRNLIEAPEFRNHKSRIACCLGADVSGRPVIFDINKMPHLLVAGATGMGKSVCINCFIMSILYKAKPDEVKLILIDPKKVEFNMYRDLPHLYAPIVSDPKKAAGCLNSAVNEMERRFELIEEVGVRNIAGYNEVTAGDPERPPLPQIVIIIDEFADLMMTASQEVETAVCRLAQKARAAGIHLIIGTQRPSVDVITGLIKANIPSRIACTVTSAVDSRTIIDTVGAEKLIGRGDMLYAPVGAAKPLRVQGAFVSDSEVEQVVTYITENNERGTFDENFTRDIEIEAAKCGNGKRKGGDSSDDFSALGGGSEEDEKFWAAVKEAVEAQKVSTSLLQRKLNLGYGRAAKIIDRMEEMGFVGPADGNKPRKLLITKQDLAEILVGGRSSVGGDGNDEL